MELTGPRLDEDLRRLRQRLGVATLFLVILLLAGVIGYRIIAPTASWVDALYMTVITLTTVGFGEVIDLSGSPGGRLFTIGLLVFGVGGAAYFVSTATAFVLEGQLGHEFWRRRMAKDISRLSDHYIVCGSGETAIYAAQELLTVRGSGVIVCDDAERADHLRAELPGLPVLVGDPTTDDVLLAAGVDRAAGVVACAENSKDNLLITLTARQLNASVRIVVEVSEIEQEPKARKAGANAVVCANFTGGLRLASELVRPTVVSFLDKMLRDRDKNLRIDEVRLPADSPLVGRRLGDIDFRGISNAMLLACRTSDEQWLYNPPPELRIESGTTLILMGSPEDVSAVRRAFRVSTA